MRERMKRIGGTLQIESRTGAGTRIEERARASLRRRAGGAAESGRSAHGGKRRNVIIVFDGRCKNPSPARR